MAVRRQVAAATGLVVLLMVAAVAAFAADMAMSAETQLKGAIAEAKAAQAAGSLQDAQAHLQSVVNCIEGPSGMMYKKVTMSGGMMSACEGKGNGLLNDAKASGAKWTGTVPYIELANDNAAAGLKATALAKARAAGWAAQSLLEQADKMMMK
jgi:hypothetical protein